MPFGLTNAPATFQILMEQTMGDLNMQSSLIYLDDIVVFLAHLKKTCRDWSKSSNAWWMQG